MRQRFAMWSSETCPISRQTRFAQRRTAKIARAAAAGALMLFSSAQADETGLAAPQPGRLHRYHIAPQPLSSALEAFATETGGQVLYDRPAGGEPASPGVDGYLSREDALAAILHGTGLMARFNSSNDIVLGPIAQSGVNGVTTGPPPIGIPMLTLDTLDASSAASGDDDLLRQSYIRLIRNSVRQALMADHRTATGDYTVMLQLWISHDGHVQRIALLTPSGDKDRDEAIAEVLHSLVISADPPPDISQPVRIGIHSRPAG